MGKKKKSKGSSYFEYYTGSGKIGKIMDRYDVEGTKTYHPDGRSNGKTGSRSKEDVNKDIAKAMMNDYDTRRTFEAAALSGNKDAKKFAKKGFKAGKIDEAWDVYTDMKKEYVGGGGMNGPKNRAGLTYAAVKSDRDKLVDSISNTGGGSDDEGQPTNPVAPNAEPSEYLANARARVQLHDEEILNGQYAENLYDKDYRPTDGGGFLARYKLRMKDSGLNLG